ncbi:MAG: hypothetical protein GWO08_18110, partial [Gammaproteobacteria bacterium]|nr:hypothetical protein [Gammaproteobacteria bacterium]
MAETVTERPETTAVVEEEKAPPATTPDTPPVIPDQVEEDPELRLVAPVEEGEAGE